jgi:hypothetical protein
MTPKLRKALLLALKKEGYDVSKPKEKSPPAAAAAAATAEPTRPQQSTPQAAAPSPGSSSGVWTCSHCGKPGYSASRCFTLHPELRISYQPRGNEEVERLKRQVEELQALMHKQVAQPSSPKPSPSQLGKKVVFVDGKGKQPAADSAAAGEEPLITLSDPWAEDHSA